jgi:Lar family restriction alleviation protein
MTANPIIEAMVEILPCPFCGGAAMLKCGKTIMVACTGCSAASFQVLRDKGSAIAAWNTRQSSPPTDAALIHDNLYDALGLLDKARALIEETRRLARFQAPLK